MRVQIYQDYVHNHGALLRALNEHYGEGAVVFRDAADIAAGCLADADLLVMPGGADLYYCEKLNGAGNAAIRSFVERGGCYLGICAGAYYGCAVLDWADGTAQQISGPRELAFYPGMAQGPVYDFLQNRDLGQSWQNVVALRYAADGSIIDAEVHYVAGPVFLPLNAPSGKVKVLACYSDLPGKPAAIVECKAGEGKAILCSPHLETGSTPERHLYRHRNNVFEWERKVTDSLAAASQPAGAIWSALMRRASLKERIAA